MTSRRLSPFQEQRQLELRLDAGQLQAPSSGPETSKLAAEAIEPAAETLRRQVLDCIRRAGILGRTDQDIQNELHLSGDTERPRRWELVKAGLIVDSGMIAKTARGRDAVVWVAR